jgi:hypothetical protein
MAGPAKSNWSTTPFNPTDQESFTATLRRHCRFSGMRPYIAFIAMLLGGVILTYAIASTLDNRLVQQEQKRELAHSAP